MIHLHKNDLDQHLPHGAVEMADDILNLRRRLVVGDDDDVVRVRIHGKRGGADAAVVVVLTAAGARGGVAVSAAESTKPAVAVSPPTESRTIAKGERAKHAVPISASAAVPEASEPSPAESWNMPRVSLNTAVWRRETVDTVLLATESLSKRNTGRVGEALRSTHFHSSLMRLPLSIGG